MNFNKTILYGLMLNLLLIAQPASAMLRRIAPQAASTLAASALIAQKRTLLPGQENHPLWIKVNQEIDEFLKNKKIAMPTEQDLKAIQDNDAVKENEHKIKKEKEHA